MVTTDEADTDLLEFEGRRFFAPAMRWGIDASERLALGTFGGGASCFDGQAVAHSVEPGAVDLSLVATGRCPLLIEHCRSLDSLVGQVVTVGPGNGCLKAAVRFARGREADRLWNLLEQNFALSLSIGASVQCAARTPDGRYIATRWRLEEISVCVFGKDQSAELRRLSDADTA